MMTLTSESTVNEKRDLNDLLKNHPFLSGLNEKAVDVLKANAMIKTFQAGEIISREGDPANRFYLIESGKVLLESYPPEGKAVKIQEIAAGDVLGWSWLFPPYY